HWDRYPAGQWLQQFGRVRGERMRTLFGHDRAVAAWAFSKARWRPIQYHMAIGVLDDEEVIRGAVLFSGWNGSDTEVHYYGPGTLSRRILKEIAIIALKVLCVNRLTLHTRVKSVARGVQKLGASYEGERPYYYGPTDEDHAHQYAFFKPQMLEFTGLKQ